MKRVRVLGAALLAAVAASLWVAGLDEADEAPSAGVARKSGLPRSRDPLPDLSLLARAHQRAFVMDGDGVNLFAPRSFQPPPAPQVEARPVAPPLPFRYSGMLDQDGVRQAFLIDGERMRAVKAGEVLDGRYRVSAVGPARIDLVYLPLNETQSLVTGTLP